MPRNTPRTLDPPRSSTFRPSPSTTRSFFCTMLLHRVYFCSFVTKKELECYVFDTFLNASKYFFLESLIWHFLLNIICVVRYVLYTMLILNLFSELLVETHEHLVEVSLQLFTSRTSVQSWLSFQALHSSLSPTGLLLSWSSGNSKVNKKNYHLFHYGINYESCYTHSVCYKYWFRLNSKCRTCNKIIFLN